MTVQVENTQLLLDALAATHNVKAVVVIDDRGYLIERRGSANCLKIGDESERTTRVAPVDPERGASENVYIVGAFDGEFIIIVFDDRMNFERIKSSIDEILMQFGLSFEGDE